MVDATKAACPRSIYFFSTYVVDLMAPQAGLDAIELRRAAGIEVVVPAAQTCCDQQAYTSGNTEQTRRVARAQLDLSAKPWPFVVPSGSCAGFARRRKDRLNELPPSVSMLQQKATRAEGN